MKKRISRQLLTRYADHAYQKPVYNPEANFEWIMNSSSLPWLELDITVPHLSILSEIKNIEHMMLQHRDDYSENYGWKSFCIHGKSFDSTREDEFYNNNDPYIWTPEAQKLMPHTVQYFSSVWPGTNYQRLRIMLLEPGGYICIHADSKISKLTAINIAITQPDQCKFVFEKHGNVPFVPGRAFWLDLSNYHTVFNDSQTPRWHIIVHQKFDEDFQKLVVNSYKKMYNKH